MKKKVFILTGANRGLGKALVDVLIKHEEFIVISISRRLSEEQKAYSSKQFHFVKVDLAGGEIAKKITALQGLIRKEHVYFINNASIINPIVKIENLDETSIDKIISVNIKSTILITKYLLKNYNKNTLTFVNISSGAANRAISYWSLYCSSKAFIQMFFNTAKSEYKQHRFFDIDPGLMDTGMQEDLRASDFPDVENFRESHQEGKLKSPIDVAKVILKKVQTN